MYGASSSIDFPTLNAQQEAFAGGDQYGPFDSGEVTREPSDAVLLTLQQRGASLGLGLSATQGREIFPIVARFGNPRLNSTPDQFEARIDWGDGTQSFGTVERFGTGTRAYQVFGMHVYDTPGAYPVRVDVTDRTDGTLSPLLNQNLSHRGGSQIAPSMTQDPTFLSRLVVAASTEPDELKLTAPGLTLATSENGGENWRARLIADGSDGLPDAQGDPDVLFDAFGNLYVAYIKAGGIGVALLSSKDNGRSFGSTALKEFVPGATAPSVSRPRLAWNAERKEIWLAFNDIASGELTVAVAQVSALGEIGEFVVNTLDLGGAVGDADIAIGADGSVAVLWEQLQDAGGIQLRFVLATLDEDATEAFGTPMEAVTANRSGEATIEALPGISLGLAPVLAWDTSEAGAYRGRLYAIFQDTPPEGGSGLPAPAGSLNVFVTWTDDGAEWVEPVQIPGAGGGRQFVPTIAVDPATGVLVAGWYDTAGDARQQMATFYVATSADGGTTFSAAQRVQLEASTPAGDGVSPLGKAKGPGGGPRLVFNNRTLHALWADNSELRLENYSEPEYEITTHTMGVIDVRPARVQIFPKPIAAVRGAPFDGEVARFIIDDPNREADEFGVSIAWGDGASSPGAVTQPDGPGTPFVVRGSHAYAETGAYPVWITVTDARSELPATAVSNVSAMQGSQTENSIAIDPTNPLRVFAASNDNSDRSASGIVVAKSEDGGVSWVSGLIGDGLDGLPPAQGDPKVAFDAYGNLFVSYLGTGSPRPAVLLASSNGGDDFRVVGLFQDATDSADQPSLAVGPGRNGEDGSVWLTWERGDSPFQVIMAAGADVTGLGTIGGFQQHYVAPAVVDGQFRNFGDIVVGPQGEVVLSYGRGIAGAAGGGPSKIVVHLDADGLGPDAFGPEVVVTETRIGIDAAIAAQARRKIDAEGNMAWDSSTGPHKGRLYLSYTDADAGPGGDGLFADTDILIRYSDDRGLTWSEAIEITDFGEQASFFPSIALDQSSGNLAVSWYFTGGEGQAQAGQR